MRFRTLMAPVRLVALTAAALLAVSRAGLADEAVDPAVERLDERIAEVRARFDDVEHIEPEALLAMAEAPLLIDVRDAREYAVSRLPGAQHADDEETLIELVEAAGDRPVVVYCSLGVRSSLAAQRLAELGHTNVSNLDGSLFRWANEGRPLVNASGPTDRAHPYNLWWGRYLKRDLHARKPEGSND